MAEFIMAIGAGVTLERAADPSSMPWAAVGEMVSRALGFHATESTARRGPVREVAR